MFARNLRLLVTEFPSDLVSSALGVSEKTLSALIEQVDSQEVKGYTGHIAARLAAAGENPHAWLEVPVKVNAQLTVALRELAAKADNKSPLRRANLRRIYENFSNEPQVLADALEVTQTSLLSVLSGDLELNDERTMHMMPRLTRAGFDKNWLEESNPTLSADKLNSLRKLAAALEVEPADEHDDPDRPRSLKSNEVSKMLNPTEDKNTTPQAAKPQDIPRGTYEGLLGKSLGPLARRVMEHKQAPPAAVTLSASAAKAATPETAAQPSSPTPTRDALRLSKQEISRHRVEALEALFTKRGSHGVRSRLWQDHLKQRAGLWSALRNGSRFFTDDLARMAEQALGLPSGWLDVGSDEQPVLPDWFNIAKPEGSAGKKPGRPAQASILKQKPQILRESPPTPPPAQASAETAPPAAQADSPSAPPPVQAPATTVNLLSANLATGPVASALLKTLQEQASSGLLTERKALSLLNLLLAE